MRGDKEASRKNRPLNNDNFQLLAQLLSGRANSGPYTVHSIPVENQRIQVFRTALNKLSSFIFRSYS